MSCDICFIILLKNEYSNEYISLIHNCVNNINTIFKSNEIIFLIEKNEKLYLYLRNIFQACISIIREENKEIIGIIESSANFLCLIEPDYIINSISYNFNLSYDVYLYNNFPIYNRKSLIDQYYYFGLPSYMIEKMKNIKKIKTNFITNYNFVINKSDNISLFKYIMSFNKLITLPDDLIFIEKIFNINEYFYGYLYERFDDLDEISKLLILQYKNTKLININQIKDIYQNKSNLMINLIKNIKSKYIPTNEINLDYMIEAKVNGVKKIYSNLFMIKLETNIYKN